MKSLRIKSVVIGISMSMIFGFGLAFQARACMDVTPSLHAVVCHYDSSGFQNFALRISSLRMSGDVPGTFCTCAFHNNSPIFNLIDYIAVVDSGTNNRVAGLSPWYASSIASSGWDSIYQIVWLGFLSQVQGAGTVANQPVEIIVRAHFPPGYAFIPMQNDLPPTIFGWGSWNDSLQRPNPDRWWLDFPFDSTFQFVSVADPSSYFANLDADLFAVGRPEMAESLWIEVFPNPVADHLNIRQMAGGSHIQALHLFDTHGRQIPGTMTKVGKTATVDVSGLPAATYYLQVETASGKVTKRIVIAR